MSSNKAVIISGCSASGKNFITTQLNSELVVSSTTRNIRDYDGEVDGIDYHFVDIEAFKASIENDEFIEFEDVFGNFYGTKKDEFTKAFDSGKMPVAIVDPLGNANLCNKLHEMGISTYSVFIDCPRNILTNRLIDRCIKSVDSGNQKAIQDSIKRLKKSFTDERTWKKLVNYDFIASGSAKETVLKIQLKNILDNSGNTHYKSVSDISNSKEAPLWVKNLNEENISISALIEIKEKINNTPLISPSI